MSKVISIKNVSYVIDNNFILKNVTLDINEKDCVAIVGPNGAGKTTLLKLLAGLITSSTGEIKILAKSNQNKNIKQQIGYIPQTVWYDKYLPITVMEAISLGLVAKYGMFKKFSDNVCLIETISKKLNISNLLNKPIGKLSGGQRQKVSIARVLLQEPKILLLDEPLSNLDTNSQKDIINILNNICLNKNITTLIVVHNLEHIPNCCNKIISICDGQVNLKEIK